MRHAALLLGGLGLAASSASASTLPPLQVERGRACLSLGLADVNLDLAVLPGMVAGFSFVMTSKIVGVAGRSTFVLGTDGWGFPYGCSFALGYGPAGPFSGSTSWAQPAWVHGLQLAPSWRLRYSLGPMFFVSQRTVGTDTLVEVQLWPVLPNAEIVYALGRWQELTLGGNAIIGWRAII